jgi:mannose/fructose/N-acetylgalactosamine-specific phosphotransferase system component IIC
MSKEFTKNLGALNGSVKNYVQTKIDLVKLTFLEKSTRFISSYFSMQIVILFAMLIIGFVAAAFAVWYGETYHNYFEGLLLAGGLLVLVGILFLILRKRIVTRFVLRNFSDIMYEDETTMANNATNKSG